MPLARYFYWVGGVLFVLLLILDAWVPKPPALAKAKVYPPVIRIYSEGKWPERIVYDTSLPTIVPAAVVATEDIIQPPEIIAEATTGASERAAFAMLTPSGERLQISNTKMRDLKPRHPVRIVRKRAPAPRFAMARHPQIGSFGWFGRNYW